MSVGFDGEIWPRWEVVDIVVDMFGGLVGTVGMDRVLVLILYHALNDA